MLLRRSCLPMRNQCQEVEVAVCLSCGSDQVHAAFAPLDCGPGEAPDLRAFHLRHGGDQDVSSFGLRQIHRHHPNVVPFQPQLLAWTSVKFR